VFVKDSEAGATVTGRSAVPESAAVAVNTAGVVDDTATVPESAPTCASTGANRTVREQVPPPGIENGRNRSR
jgi:hypothetical protein